MLPCYVLLDLETTGGNVVHDRITEIAAVRIEAGQEVARWSTLVNPGTPIPPFIQNLTGISDTMVAQAPAFADVAQALLRLLEGAVLVAHNVRFDHSFLLHELARLEQPLRIKTLCTVRLSRALYPEHRSHGLDALMQRHGLSTLTRHRAMSDVQVLTQWLQQAQTELGAQHVAQQAQALLQSSAALPPHLATHVGDIPDGTGVYTFYGEGPLPLYIGKSIHLRSRVMAHFQAASKDPREMKMVQDIRRIEWTETAGEFGALLLEARRVKEQQPLYNRQLRRESTLCAWHLDARPTARPLLKLVRADELKPQAFDQLYGVYRSKNQALATLRELADTQGLCLQAMGLESGKGRCFAHQVGRCQGVCCGQESPESHHRRVQQALADYQLQVWPHDGPIGLQETNSASGRTDTHLFHHWSHLCTVQGDADLADALNSPHPALAFDLDTYRLLLKHLSDPGKAGLTLIRY